MSATLPLVAATFAGNLLESWPAFAAKFAAHCRCHLTSGRDEEKLDYLELALTGSASLYHAQQAGLSFEAAWKRLESYYGSPERTQALQQAAQNAIASRTFRAQPHQAETVATFVDELSLNCALAGITSDNERRALLLQGFSAFPVCIKMLNKASTFDLCVLEALKWEQLMARSVHFAVFRDRSDSSSSTSSVGHVKKQSTAQRSLAETMLTLESRDEDLERIRDFPVPHGMHDNMSSEQLGNMPLWQITSQLTPQRSISRTPSIKRIPPPSVADEEPPVPFAYNATRRASTSLAPFPPDSTTPAEEPAPELREPSRRPSIASARPSLVPVQGAAPNLYASVGPHGEHSLALRNRQVRPRKLKRKASKGSGTGHSSDDSHGSGIISRFLAGSFRQRTSSEKPLRGDRITLVRRPSDTGSAAGASFLPFGRSSFS